MYLKTSSAITSYKQQVKKKITAAHLLDSNKCKNSIQYPSITIEHMMTDFEVIFGFYRKRWGSMNVAKSVVLVFKVLKRWLINTFVLFD